MRCYSPPAATNPLATRWRLFRAGIGLRGERTGVGEDLLRAIPFGAVSGVTLQTL